MATAGAASSFVESAEVDGDAGAQHVVVVYECTRIGLTANPPFSFVDWLRFGRRR